MGGTEAVEEEARSRLRRRMTSAAVLQALGVVAASAISLITFAAITRALGPATFGAFAAAVAFLNIPALLLDSGLSIAVVRRIATDPSSAERELRASMPVRAGSAALVIAAAVGLSHILPFSGETRTAVLITALGAFAGVVGATVVPVLQSELRVSWLVVGNVSGRVLTLALTVAAIRSDMGLEGVAWAYVAGNVLTAVVQTSGVARRMRILPTWDTGYARLLMREAAELGAATGIGMIYWRIDSVLIALIRDAREVGLYSAAVKFTDLAGAFVGGVYTSLFPSLTRFVADRDPRARGLVQRAFEVLIALAVPVAVLGWVFTEEIVTTVAGDDYRDARVALEILALSPVFSFTGALLERGLLAVGRERLVMAANAIMLGVNVGLNALLLPTFGYTAAAAVTIVSEVGWVVIGARWFRRELGFLPDVRPLVPVVLAAAAMAGTCALAPVPAIVAIPAGLAAYLAVLAALPGSIRSVIRETPSAVLRART